MTLYRDRFDIIASILETAKMQARHTDILRTASISHIPFKQYLLLLHANGLIEYSPREKNLQDYRKRTIFPRHFQQDEEHAVIRPTISSSVGYVKLKLQFRK
jgi:hypothetical protein